MYVYTAISRYVYTAISMYVYTAISMESNYCQTKRMKTSYCCCCMQQNETGNGEILQNETRRKKVSEEMKICLNFVPNCFEEQEEPLQAWEAELHNS